MKTLDATWFGLAVATGVFLAGCTVDSAEEDALGVAASDIVDAPELGTNDDPGIDREDPEPDPWTPGARSRSDDVRADPEPDPWAPTAPHPAPET
jgi:hypothetical protein